MNITSTAKTAAVVLVIAAIPITILWRQNSELEEELRLARSRPLITQTAAAAPRTASTPGSDAKKTAAASAAVPVKPEAAPNPMAGFISKFSGDGMIKRVNDEAKKRTDLEFKRICLNLPDLTEEQKTQIKAALEKQSAAAVEEITKVMQSGAVMRALQDPASLTKEEKAALSKMDPRKNAGMADEAALQSILTEDQYAQYTKTREARRVSNAENAATDALRGVSRTIDLSPEQKDTIFQALAEHELAPADPNAEISSPFPGMRGGSDEAQDKIIRENLTPEQVAVFDQSRAQEKESRKQMMQFFPKPSAPPQ